MWDDEDRARRGAHADAEDEAFDASTLDLELLAEGIGRILLSNPDNPVWRDERFLAWLAVEARARAEREIPIDEREAAGAARRRGEELMARAQARRAKVARHHEEPQFDARPPAMAGAIVLATASGGAIPMLDFSAAAGVGLELWDMECDTVIERPAGLPKGKYVALRVAGDSMEPLMHGRDTILVRVDPKVQADSVIVARHPEDGYVCKRVHRIGDSEIELASLAPGRPLIVIPRDPRLIVGTVVALWCEHAVDGGDRAAGRTGSPT